MQEPKTDGPEPESRDVMNKTGCLGNGIARKKPESLGFGQPQICIVCGQNALAVHPQFRDIPFSGKADPEKQYKKIHAHPGNSEPTPVFFQDG